MLLDSPLSRSSNSAVSMIPCLLLLVHLLLFWYWWRRRTRIYPSARWYCGSTPTSITAWERDEFSILIQMRRNGQLERSKEKGKSKGFPYLDHLRQEKQKSKTTECRISWVIGQDITGDEWRKHCCCNWKKNHRQMNRTTSPRTRKYTGSRRRSGC